ncbi:M20/M25/M40 family metallo-hydrolase [Tenacibaculum maritimum]|uniref:M20/M25/M40 family metallo-hydrolase n=1 Tax=Tenacibaculum maritimum TaxID=107401 RepID=UPI0038777828
MKNIPMILVIMTTILLLSCKETQKISHSKEGDYKRKVIVSTQEINIPIQEATVKKHLYTLASDEMEGRKPGTLGIEKAAKYIENEFEKIGLKTFENLVSYRQNFRHKEIGMSNIIGVLEGKSKKEEYVVISAHYDHLGMKKGKEGDVIFNGADDDASGVAAVLTLAAYFKKEAINERTIVFIAFTGEEMGLLGSTYFGKQVNASKYIAGINIEMIGKESSYGAKSAWLTGFERSNFGKIIQKNLKGTGYKLYPDPYPSFNLFFRSDNASLARLGIPSHTFSTGPIDKDIHYHNVSDEATTLNIANITETIKAIALGTKSIIEGKDTPTRVLIKK